METLNTVLITFLIGLTVTFHKSSSYVPRQCLENKDVEQVSDYHTVVCNAQFGERYHGHLNGEIEYIFVFSNDVNRTAPPRITVASEQANTSRPLLVVVTQLKSILSWQVPLESGRFVYKRVSRTLCPDPENGDVVVSISTRSSLNISFDLWVNITEHFNIELSKPYGPLKVSPSEPHFYKFEFTKNVSSALIHVESEENSPCMSFSIQNYSCPVYDLEKTVQFRGLWQTVLTRGGIFLRKEEFPKGMFIVFVVHSTDEECTLEESSSWSKNRTKSVTFTLVPGKGPWHYIIAVACVLGGFLFVYLTAAFCVLCKRRRSDLECLVVDPPRYPSNGPSCTTTPTTPIFSGGNSCDSDLSESEADWDYDKDTSIQVQRSKPILYLSDLAQKDPRILSLKSSLYLWNMLTIAVFYALPVVQLVFTYQKTLMNSGNEDLCYYNSLCSHRLSFMSDFNHVFSNIGYILFGLLFLGLTYRRQKICHSIGSHLGIPYHFGMFYALGVALCMEGVLSACYHLCPNHSNFQFDTSFMYVLSMVSMIKIYQTRHPDITASAYTTFGALALVIFLGTVGVLEGSPWFYVFFTIVHLLTCFVITAQIYHVGSWKFDLKMFNRFVSSCKDSYNEGGIRKCVTPLYPARMVLLFLANVGNWGMVAAGAYVQIGDFATYMLSIFLANLLMYFIFYIVMKMFSGEKILTPPLLFIFLSFAFWAAGLYFFYHKSISWKKTPAQSRAYNQPCEILDFYDKHDIWHFLSAGGMFFSFMVLLTLDDDIAEKDRLGILVF